MRILETDSEGRVMKFAIRRPDDWHHHFRMDDRALLAIPWAQRVFARVVGEPNTAPQARTSANLVEEYTDFCEAIAREADPDVQYPDFQVLNLMKLTDNTTPEMISEASGYDVLGLKAYPAKEGLTTNSAEGVANWRGLEPTLREMEALGLYLQIHGEHPDSEFCLDRERDFVHKILPWIVYSFPNLKIILEHISTAEAVEFVRSYQGGNLAASVTVHHLFLTLNDVIGGYLKPHHFCKPIAQKPADLAAIREVVLFADLDVRKKFFLGTDAAPHKRDQKESDCGCAGVWTTPVAMQMLTALFLSQAGTHTTNSRELLHELEAGMLRCLEQFTSEFGATYYGFPIIDSEMVMVRNPWVVPAAFTAEGMDGEVVPFMAGQELEWQIEGLEMPE